MTMVENINAGDKEALRKLLKLYSQAVFQRARALTGTDAGAKLVARHVFEHVTLAAKEGKCRKDVDPWLIKLTDACAYEYLAQLPKSTPEKAAPRSAQKEDYFTAPNIDAAISGTDVYAAPRDPIYEKRDSASEKASAQDAYEPFKASLHIPQRPEFADRQDFYYSSSRPASNAGTAPPLIDTFDIPKYTPFKEASAFAQAAPAYAPPPSLLDDFSPTLDHPPNKGSKKQRKKKDGSVFIVLLVIVAMLTLAVLAGMLVTYLLGQ